MPPAVALLIRPHITGLIVVDAKFYTPVKLNGLIGLILAVSIFLSPIKSEGSHR